MKVTIDPSSGFCFGVKNAIELAEHQLNKDNSLNCLGEIVHNQEEIKRLESKGLKTIHHEEFKQNKHSRIFLRAHGEPPATYAFANQHQIEVIDATCPIVLKLQERVRKASDEMLKRKGQVVIYGSKNHPEMIGLLGQVDSLAVALETESDLKNIDFRKPIRLFSQTTKSKEEYQRIIERIRITLTEKSISQKNFIFSKSVCGQVANRAPKLKAFCKSNDVIIFVSGKNSSNGKYLFSVCQSVHENCYLIAAEEEINPFWFENKKSVGISGATSTPIWLLQKVAKKIKLLV
ncbi:MAG: 4-hydroxy-3-methylbut-2-enyl diphosphate reductase [Bacteroidales bacterium]